MTVYLLLTLTDDTEASAFEIPREAVRFQTVGIRAVNCSDIGNDRGRFVTYEVAGYSIDVVRLPEARDKPCVNCERPRDFYYDGVLQTICTACSDSNVLLRTGGTEVR